MDRLNNVVIVNQEIKTPKTSNALPSNQFAPHEVRMEVGEAALDSETEAHEQVNVQTVMSYSRARIKGNGAEAPASPTGLPQ